MKKRNFIIGGVVFVLLCGIATLFYFGVLQFNNPSRTDYPVRGVDVSSYQGEIDWPVFSGQGIDFAFIKATEGSSLVDSRFAENWAGAQGTDLRIGAYHFFSFDSPGASQAELFMQTVAAVGGMLPPIVDVEFYGEHERNPPAREDVTAELDVLLQALEARYSMPPILYATSAAYDLYLADAYPENDIWIRDVVGEPKLSDGRAWTFWQYSNRVRLDGYHGSERFIDMNVFAGDAEAFVGYAAR